MPSTQASLTEWALRSAVNTSSRTVTAAGSGQPEDIQRRAEDRAKLLVSANSNATGIQSQMGAAVSAIAAAVVVLKLAYDAVSRQLGVLKNFRLSFDKERQAGIATFIVPTNQEEANLSKEEKVIKSFVELSNASPSFSTYLGIHNGVLAEEAQANFYSVLPFYRMSDGLGQPVASPSPLDRQRTAISLFFKSALPDALRDIETDFQTDSKFVAFFRSAFQQSNYLNDRRAPRFLMMSLANLLWNLQHPVDQETGFPLSLTKCIEICRDVEVYLNQLLNFDAPPDLQKISNKENRLISFVRKVEIHTKALRAAYAEEQLHGLNISEVTNSAHRALRIMDQCVFKLVYKRSNQLTGKDEPNDKAAEELAYTISYLNQLIGRNPDLIKSFRPFVGLAASKPKVNSPPITVIDGLVIFCHLSTDDRHLLLRQIEGSGFGSAMEFAETLRDFDLKFIKPIRRVAEVECNATRWRPKVQEVIQWVVSRLVPLLTLVVEDYRIEVDTYESYGEAKSSQTRAPEARLYSGKDQVQAINKIAEEGTGVYRWALSPFVGVRGDTAAKLDLLPVQQYRMTQMTKLMDSVSELVQNYRSLLQHHEFQDFMLKCLGKVKEEYAKLDARIDAVDNALSRDEMTSRGLKAVLRPMIGDLNGSLDEFQVAASNFERVVSAPDFTDQQRQELSAKIGSVHQQYATLFEEDSGIVRLMDVAPIIFAGAHDAAPLREFVESRKVVALIDLVQRCYDALSYQSKEGHKGALILDLRSSVRRKVNFREADIKQVVMELLHVTASYRETWFFQAAYGQTRSAKALINAIKDPDINGVLPLASIIFERADVDFMQISDAEILQRLKGLRDTNQWQEAEHQIEAIAVV